MANFIRKLFCSVVIWTFLIPATILAQQLSSVAKFRIIKRDDITTKKGNVGNVNSGFLIVEVRPGKDGWDCYKFRISGFDYQNAIIDTSKTFFKHIPTEKLNQLLNIISRPDTQINAKIFKIDKAELLRYIDTINNKLNPEQKAKFVEAVQSDTIIENTLRHIIHHSNNSNNLCNIVTIINKSGSSFSIKSDYWPPDYLYGLPWYTDSTQYYDPNINIVVAFIFGDENYPTVEKHKLYYEIDEEIYSKYFITKFNWDDFKLSQPISFAILKNTLTPNGFYVNNGMTSVYFRSSLLPAYVELYTYFKQGDTSAIRSYKRFEDTLTNMFKKDNFLFKYLRTSPETKMLISPGLMGREIGNDILDYLKRYFNNADTIDYKRALFITLYGGGLDSHWIWLPNNSLILLQFYGQQTGDKVSFMNFNAELFKPTSPYPVIHYPGMLFDASGNLIRDHGPDYGSNLFDIVHY